MGYSVVTTVLSAAAGNDLTDLDTAKDELSIQPEVTKDDTWLRRAVTQVSAAIANYTNRVFAPELVQDVFDIEQDPYPYQTPGGFPALALSRWPVLAVVSVVQTLAPGSTQILVEDTDFRSDRATGRLLRLNAFTGVVTLWEAMPVTVKYSAGYGAAIFETQTVPALSPYQITVNGASAFSCDQTVAYVDGVLLTLVAAVPAAGQYSVAAGVYTFNVADAGQVLSFAYCTKVVPDDLVDATLQLITGRFRARGRDPSLIQRETPGIGTERFWFGGAPGQTGPFPPDIAALLDNYKVPVVA